MRLYNSWRGSVRDADLPKDRIAREEGIDPPNMLLLVSPDGTQLKDAPADKVFVYDKTWPPIRNEQVDGNPFIVLEGAQLVYTHMHHNLDVVHRQLRRLEHAKAQLEEDVAACGEWKHYYEALQKIPKLGGELARLLDVEEIAESHKKLNGAWKNLDAALSRLVERMLDMKQLVKTWPPKADCHDLESSQAYLAQALRTASDFQTRLITELRRPLAALSDEVKRVEELKSKVAKIIDLPFLYGVLLIESSRRAKWDADVGPIRDRELGRRREWYRHYGTGNLGALVKQLDDIGEFHVVNEEQQLREPEPVRELAPHEQQQQVGEYLQQLEELGLKDVSEDLKGELGAMRRQFAKSMSASLISVSSNGSTNGIAPPTTPPSNGGAASAASAPASADTVAAYESRLRKLETMLMQAKLGAKTHEMDLVRAEARASARAEIQVEQQQAKVAALESRNRELADRLKHYTQGLENVLNSMGLQTSREDDDGNPAYQVNRVKGLSRRVSSESSGKSISDSVLLEQTYINNHVLFEAVNKRFGDVEKLARRLQVDKRHLVEAQASYERELRQRVALHSFKPEDLILFLPTRDPRRHPNPWAAFNAGAPHYFLHPQHTEQLKNREYLIARASAVEKHVSSAADNPYDLPTGVEWYLISIHGEWCV